MLADKQLLVSLGDQFYKLDPINKQPSSLAADIFYAISQVVMLEASP